MKKQNTTDRRVRFQRGFTLVEMAVVLVIFAILLGGLIVPLSAQIDMQRYNETKNILEDTKGALLGYVTANKRLPCPDTDGDGLEQPLVAVIQNDTPAPQSTQTFSCPTLEGRLPFQTLSVGRMDGWSNQLLYRVSPAFSTRTKVFSANNAMGAVISDTYFTLTSTGNIAIQTRGDDPGTAAVETKFLLNLATNVPAVIISHGKNGYGAISSDGTAMPLPPVVNADEETNRTAGTTKIIRTVAAISGACSDTVEGSASCEFDDVVTWLSANVIVNRMVMTGQLP
ncbi:MAG: type II secretion system protein [Methylotenera sp.]